MQRIEYQFILLGLGFTLVIGTLTNLVIPLMTGHSASQSFGPVSILAMNLVIAYGIATRRIVEVSQIIRVGTAYSLLILYLVGLYAVTWIAVYFVVVRVVPAAAVLPHLVAALAMAFSLTPAHGVMQRFASRLFINQPVADLGETVQKVSAVVQSIGTLDVLLGRFAAIVSDAVDAQRIVVLVADDASFRQMFPADDETPLEIPRVSPLVKAVEEADPVLVVDIIERMPLTSGLEEARERMSELHVSAAVGIRSKGRLEGVMLLGPRKSGRVYGRPEQHSLKIVADQLAVAIENATLYTQLQDSKIYNDILVDNMVSGVIAANDEQIVTVFNREAQRITRLSPSQVLNHSISSLQEPLVAHFKETFISAAGVRNMELELRHGPGDGVPVQLGSSVFRGHKGNVLGAILVLSDISLVKKLETQVRRSSHLASLGTLSAGMAHEIKNPLVTLKTFSQLLPDRYEDDEFRNTFSELVEQEVNRIDSIVNQLLKFGRPAEAVLAPVSIRVILEHALRLANVPMEQKGIYMKTDWCEDDDMIMGDAGHLEQAFVNFLLNAIDAMEEGGTLTVTTLVMGPVTARGSLIDGVLSAPHVDIRISDTGTGISSDDLAQVFDPFFTTKTTGTGMGLSVAHGIIAEHNGLIEVESEVDEGTAFIIVLPCITKEQPA